MRRPWRSVLGARFLTYPVTRAEKCNFLVTDHVTICPNGASPVLDQFPYRKGESCCRYSKSSYYESQC